MGEVDADALLAQALWAAEQADIYEHHWGGGDGSDDSDYKGDKARKRRRQQQRRVRTKQPRKSAGAAPAAAQALSVSAPPQQNDNSSTDHTPAALHQVIAAEINCTLSSGTQLQQAQLHVTSLERSCAQLTWGAAAAAAPVPVVATSVATKEQQEQQAQGSNSDGGLEQQEHGPSGRRKRKDCGHKREAGRAWTATEETSFLAGLEQHGRDWKAVADMIGTRDSRQVASHAQKHFVKLCLAGQPLPTKVAESGMGYTLSGKPLDPHSAAAKAYGFKLELLQGLQGEALATARAGILPAGTASGDIAQGARDQTGRPVSAPHRHKHSKPDSRACSSSREAPLDHNNSNNTATVADGSGCRDASNEACQLAAALAAPPPVLAASERKVLEAEAAKAAAAAVISIHASAENLETTAAAGWQTVSKPADTAAVGSDSAATAITPVQDQPTVQIAGPAGEAAGGSTADAAATAQPAAALPGAQAANAAAFRASSTVAASVATSSAAAPDTRWVEEVHMTDYARSRPRRSGAGQRLLQLGATSESLELLPCMDFTGPVGSGLPSAQPYIVEVEMQAMLVMEIHAHCSSYEVIGLLGGSWDSNARLMRVAAAYPCSRAAGSDARTSVELAPEAEVEARGAMAAAGQRCVGWYHSHPVFEPSPSLKDCENQRNYQALTRDTSTTAATVGLEPFVGFILSPYDLSLPRPYTNIRAFVVQQKGAQLMPYNVRYGMVGTSLLPAPPVRPVLRSLLSSLVLDVGRTDFNATWRPFTALGGPTGMAPLGPPLSKLEKLLVGLRWQATYIAERAGLESWLQQLCADIQELWDLPLEGLTQKPGPEQQQQVGAEQ